MMVKVLTKAFYGPDLGRFGPILAPKCQKSKFLTILSSLVNGTDLILDIFIVLNSLHDLDMVLVMFCIISYA